MIIRASGNVKIDWNIYKGLAVNFRSVGDVAQVVIYAGGNINLLVM